MLPQAFKFLWAPAIERLRLAPDGRRRSRAIILLGQLLTIAAVGLLAGGMSPVWMLGLLALAALLTATTDIACDAFAVEQLDGSAGRGWGNVMQVGGAYLGMMIGGGAFLLLLPRLGWGAGVLLLAGALAVLTLPLLAIREPDGMPRPRAPRPALRHAFARPAMRRGLLAVALMQPGLRVALGLLGPFLVDRGLALDEIGLLTGIGGTLAGLAGTLLAGAAITRCGGAAALLRPAILLQAAIFAGLLAAILLPGLPVSAVTVLVLLLALAGGGSFVILYTAMMGWSAGDQPGVDFTLLQCTDAVLAAVLGLGAGALAQHFGYAACFGLATAAALTGAWAVPMILRRNPEIAA